MRFKISVNFIGEFRVVAVIATPLVGRFYKKKCNFRRVEGQQPHPYRNKWRGIGLETLRTLKIFLDPPIHFN